MVSILRIKVLFKLKIQASIVKPFIKYLDEMKYKTIKVIYYDK